jgi:xanthine/CO dehydrogenase XdhC/CoxF family maturation factor
VGSISGGCLEEDIVARAKIVGATGKPELVVYDTTSENDLVWGVGLGCHGVVRVLIERVEPAPKWAQTLIRNLEAHQPTPLEVIWAQATDAVHPLGTYLADAQRPRAQAAIFFETVQPPTTVYVYGAGDDARPLVRILKEMGWRVCVADPRPAFATAERFPTADRVIVAPTAQLVDLAAPPPDALAVVMTHHYVHDLPILAALLQRPLRYIGLLGPKKRGERILSDLVKQGLRSTPDPLGNLHSPVGLDLGAETPEEVALSIVAEMRAVLGDRKGGSLRERKQPIHG